MTNPAVSSAPASSQAATSTSTAATSAASAVQSSASAVPASSVASTSAASSVASVAYDLKLSAGAQVDPAIVERTATIARTLGLGNDAAQRVLDAVTAEVEQYRTAQTDAAKPGGAMWVARETELRTQALADPLIAGDQAKLDKTVALAQQVVRKFGGEDTVALLKETLLASDIRALRFLANIGAAMSESSFIPAGQPVGGKLPMAKAMYGPDGMGKPKTE